MGALAGIDGTVDVVLNQRVLAAAQVPADAFDAVRAAELVRLRRREAAFRRDLPALPVTGRTVVVVDDGAATGSTVRAAVAALRRRHPAHVVVALPVCPPDTAAAEPGAGGGRAWCACACPCGSARSGWSTGTSTRRRTRRSSRCSARARRPNPIARCATRYASTDTRRPARPGRLDRPARAPSSAPSGTARSPAAAGSDHSRSRSASDSRVPARISRIDDTVQISPT
ncbi:phosphoribosyltransferase family protein [Cellulomonas sp. Marseille-Q8402]